MSRWSISDLAELTPQQVFDRCAYHLIANGGAPRDVLLKPESIEYRPRNRWRYLVKQKRAPRTHAQLIEDIETIHRDRDPAEWLSALENLARAYKLEVPG